MATQVRINSQTPRQTQDDYHYNRDTGYDFGFENDALDSGSEDEYLPNSQQSKRPQEGQSAGEMRSRIQEFTLQLKQNNELSEDERKNLLSQLNVLKGKINFAQSLTPKERAAMLVEIEKNLGAVETKALGLSAESEDNGEDGVVSSGELESKLKAFKKKLGEMKSLTKDERIEMEAKIDKWLTAIKLAKGDPEKVDLDEISTEFAELETEAEKTSQYPTAAKGIAKALDMEDEMEVLLKKAENFSPPIDLNNISNPPSADLLKFMAKLSPELEKRFEDVEAAVNKRQLSIEKNLQKAKSINEANLSSTTDCDNTNTESWENLYKLKFHTDDESIKVAEAMQEVLKELKPIFEAIYPNEKVELVKTSGVSGWEKAHQQYLVAGQIRVGGTVINLFDITDGKIQSSTLTPTEAEFEIPAILHDNEGDGQWHVPLLETYSNAQPAHVGYDPGA